MTTNPKESQPTPPESQGIPPAATPAAETATDPAAAVPTEPQPDPGAEVEIIVDHTYLPLDKDGNGRADWSVTSDATSRVSRGTRLRVPTDLALHLVEDKKQAVLK
jgi:hypothetical protein